MRATVCRPEIQKLQIYEFSLMTKFTENIVVFLCEMANIFLPANYFKACGTLCSILHALMLETAICCLPIGSTFTIDTIATWSLRDKQNILLKLNWLTKIYDFFLRNYLKQENVDYAGFWIGWMDLKWMIEEERNKIRENKLKIHSVWDNRYKMFYKCKKKWKSDISQR